MNPRYEIIKTHREARRKNDSSKYNFTKSEGTDKSRKSGSELEVFGR